MPLQELESRVGVARGQLLEKDLIIEELDSLSAKLQSNLLSSSIAPGAPGGALASSSQQSDTQLTGGAALARQVADLQVRVCWRSIQYLRTCTFLMYFDSAAKLVVAH